MTFMLYDVGHGFCAYAEGSNGTNTLFDCGHDEGRFRPSVNLPAAGISNICRMVLGNFDSDHVSDLENLRKAVNIQHFIRNRSLTVEQLRQIKLQAGPLTAGIHTVLKMHSEFVYPDTPIDYAGVELTTFCNSYPTFTDTNNLSVVSFLEYDGSCVCIPGDLEVAGWKELLKNPSFTHYLGRVVIFVASHHGRKSGYCADVFDYCRPAVILISDRDVIYESQEHEYTRHAAGIIWNGSPTEKRYVLTTRCDGHMYVTKEIGKPFHITVGKAALAAKAG